MNNDNIFVDLVTNVAQTRGANFLALTFYIWGNTGLIMCFVVPKNWKN